MILRRVATSVRAQDWTAVAIEFVILVVGVFIGIQVSNWNDARAFEAQEATYLAQLRSEITDNVEAINHQIRFVEQLVAGGRRALAFLEAEADCANGCEALLIDFFHASQVWGTGYSEGKYRELERLGLPSDESTRRAVQVFYQFIDGWDAVNATPPIYRERVRGYFPPEVSEVLWRGCYELRGGQLEALSRGCVGALEPLDVEPILRAVRSDRELAAQLRYWMGQNLAALGMYPDMRAHADRAIQAIDRVLEAGE